MDNNYNNDKFTDVEFTELEDDIYYTAVQVAEIIKVDINTLRSWAKPDTFEKELDIKRVNGRRVYTKQDIENLKFIKELRDKNYQIKLIKEWIAKRGFQYAEYDGGLIDTKDPMGFNALAESIMLKNKEQLKLFIEEFMKGNIELMNGLNKKIDSITDKVNSIEGYTRDTEEATLDIKNDINNHIKITENINKSLEKTNEELTESNRLNKDFANNIESSIDDITNKIVDKIIPKFQTITVEEYKKLKDKQPKGLIEKWFGKK